jgi:hypothetical protein
MIVDHRFTVENDSTILLRGRLPQAGVDRQASPSYRIRGLNPWGNFVEGMAWWGEDDYIALITNMAKLRANMLAIVAYSGPILWRGPASDVQLNGSVPGEITDGSGFMHWGGPRAEQTQWGTNQLFANASACAKPAWLCPSRPPLGAPGAVATDWGRFFNKIRKFAKAMGLQTALAVQVSGSAVLHGNNSAIVDNFVGTLTRLQRLGSPPDYFQLWTGEDWEWQNVSTHSELGRDGKTYIASQRVSTATAEFVALAKANAQLGSKYKLGTGGWELGPSDDEAFWDRVLGPEYEAIGSQVGIQLHACDTVLHHGAVYFGVHQNF